MGGIAIDGEVAAGFEGVRDAFVANFTDRGEVGAAVPIPRGDWPSPTS